MKVQFWAATLVILGALTAAAQVASHAPTHVTPPGIGAWEATDRKSTRLNPVT